MFSDVITFKKFLGSCVSWGAPDPPDIGGCLGLGWVAVPVE